MKRGKFDDMKTVLLLLILSISVAAQTTPKPCAEADMRRAAAEAVAEAKSLRVDELERELARRRQVSDDLTSERKKAAATTQGLERVITENKTVIDEKEAVIAEKDKLIAEKEALILSLTVERDQLKAKVKTANKRTVATAITGAVFFVLGIFAW